VAQPSAGHVPAASVTPAEDAALAAWLADRAGAVLCALRAEFGFADPNALRRAGDRRSHELLVDELARLRPGDAVLSEEGADDPTRLAADRVWIVDPLDGTREYAEAGRIDWAVHVALWARGELVAGAVALPGRGVMLGTVAPPVVPPRNGGPIRLAASRTRPPAFLRALSERLGAVEVPMGSAGAKIAAVICGEVDAYVHAGGQYEWDSAAPVVVALTAGLHASRVDGSPLTYNQPSPHLPDLLVCRPELAAPIMSTLDELGVERDT
jgi:3'(2'), 5'-bisphosphate nucleotidase